ncbi:MAG: putative molybdenum carrier protein [Methylotetracoccus sp.]|jgi:hypothetical protein|nr:putative molybdenum carrier protein [Methylotetracoccus sp.]
MPRGEATRTRLKLTIISGGQTGVDRGALDAALAAGVTCRGWCPAGRLAEDGPLPDRYPLTELAHGGYPERTLKNIQDSDGTVILHFGRLEGGTLLTASHCAESGKPHRLIDLSATPPGLAVDAILRFIAESRVTALNVAGPRASEEPRAYDTARQVIGRMLQRLTAAVSWTGQ